MLKRIIEFLFGAKLPCGCGYRFRVKLGDRRTCPRCGNVYTRVKFIKHVYDGDVAHTKEPLYGDELNR